MVITNKKLAISIIANAMLDHTAYNHTLVQVYDELPKFKCLDFKTNRMSKTAQRLSVDQMLCLRCRYVSPKLPMKTFHCIELFCPNCVHDEDYGAYLEASPRSSLAMLTGSLPISDQLALFNTLKGICERFPIAQSYSFSKLPVRLYYGNL